VHLQPSKEDDYTDLSCEARHEALLKEYPLRTTVQLSVMCKWITRCYANVAGTERPFSADPPGPPRIDGYEEGETIRRGQPVELVCRSKGGNPPAQLVWYRNDVQVQSVWNTKGRFSENFYKFTASAADNNARVVCEARSVMSKTPLKTEVKLSVHCE
jgi:nephron